MIGDHHRNLNSQEHSDTVIFDKDSSSNGTPPNILNAKGNHIVIKGI